MAYGIHKFSRPCLHTKKREHCLSLSVSIERFTTTTNSCESWFNELSVSEIWPSDFIPQFSFSLLLCKDLLKWRVLVRRVGLTSGIQDDLQLCISSQQDVRTWMCLKNSPRQDFFWKALATIPSAPQLFSHWGNEHTDLLSCRRWEQNSTHHWLLAVMNISGSCWPPMHLQRK